ncbi:MAG: peptidoglycan DD-metalloendopeptidase family protein [Deltaproteobacteria bacterium]|nr:peptidoglycan DD-metalloendopeptidase family protein [Deltaproteobacteria bacterium]
MRNQRFQVRSAWLLGFAVGAAIFSQPAWASRAARRSATTAPRPAAAAPASNKSVRHVVQRTETLTGILAKRGLSRREIAQWDKAIRTAAGPVQLAPGHVLVLQLERGGRLAALNYEVDNHTRVVVERAGKQLRGRTEPLAIKVTVVGAEGVVEKNFHQAARRTGIPDQIISQMADILGWEFDFRRVQAGDRFRVLYERRVSSDGRVLPPGRVLAAEIRSAKRLAQAFYYDDGVEGTYVDASGRVLAQSFLRYPVEFTRISSVFSGARFHPILKHTRPHNGVDFAAPVGTPVRAAGDGVVIAAGRNGDYGNQIAVRHGEGLSTTYSHLRGIARDLRAGTAVRQGQVIGWVGQTGLTTGPHLHFALYRNGQYLNPLTARVSLRRLIADPQRFQLAKQGLLTRLAGVPRPPSAVPVEPTLLAALPPTRRPGVVSITQ